MKYALQKLTTLGTYKPYIPNVDKPQPNKKLQISKYT